MRSLTLNIDFDLTLANLNKIYESAINDIFGIDISLSEKNDGPGKVYFKTFCGCLKETMKFNYEPLKKFLFEKEKIEKEFKEYIIENQKEILWNEGLIKEIEYLKNNEIITELNLLSNNLLSLLNDLDKINKINFDNILARPLIKKPCGYWINTINNNDPNTNILLGDSILDIICGKKANLPKENIICYKGYVKETKAEKLAGHTIEKELDLRRILEEKNKILNDFKIPPLI